MNGSAVCSEGEFSVAGELKGRAITDSALGVCFLNRVLESSSSCVGCLIELKDGIDQWNLGTRAVHLVEVPEKVFPKGE